MKPSLKQKKKPAKTPAKRAKHRAVLRPIALDTNTLLKLSESVTTRFSPTSLPTQFFLFDVDPHRLHATWNIYPNDPSLSNVFSSSSMNSEAFILRLYRIEPNDFQGSTKNRMVDEIHVAGLSNALYISPLHGGGLYQAELGLFDTSNAFHLIIRSNTIHVPPPRIKRLVAPTPDWAVHKKEESTPEKESYTPGALPTPSVEWNELSAKDHATAPEQQTEQQPTGTPSDSTQHATTGTQQRTTSQRGEPASYDNHYFSGNSYFYSTD